MSLFGKIKDLFVEEVDETTESLKKEEPIKKEAFKVEIKAPEEKRVESTPVVKKEAPLTPVFFDDVDFETIEHKEPINSVKRDPYMIRPEKRDATRIFKPTPIISPVYGVLDKNYSKEDITDKKLLNYYDEKKEEPIDTIRKKAYGTLEDDLETTLISRTSVFGKEELNKEIDKRSLEDTLENDILNVKKKDTDLNDSELFSLIDSMYNKEDK